MRKLQIDEMGRLSVPDFKAEKKYPIVVVLDNIRSMHNVGAAFRTADACRVQRLMLCGITAQPPHREINKTALGATESVSWEYFEQTKEALQQLKEKGYEVIAVEQTTESQTLHSFPLSPNKKYAFVFGNEVFGVDEEALAYCDASIEIPQFGTKHSLNVSVSIGMVLWEYLSTILKNS